jgi:SAM-dependent methyltransferase
MYDELAEWWPLLSAPGDYADEAAFISRVLNESCESAPRTLLELGSGGGNNASYLKTHYAMTLVDASARMLGVSRALNPECEHVAGDMRTVRLGRRFDAVLVHDAIMYMTTEADLRAALATAFAHCRVGGAALLVPDYVRETFVARSATGGHDSAGRGLRYLEWAIDPDPADDCYTVDYAIMLREADGTTRVVHDRHVQGLFARSRWLELLHEAGFEPSVTMDEWKRDVFIAKRRG